MQQNPNSIRRRSVNPFYAGRIASRNSTPRTVQPFKILDLFSGIGGFSLGLERAGMQTAAFCEIDPYCREIIARHWPNIPTYSDIRTLNSRSLHHDNIHSIDLICGGYPCQPFSIAGKQRGAADPRHLWPEMHRIIREIRPRWVICENVAGHVELGLDTVLDDLESSGYTATTFNIPACAVGTPHRRERIWIVAHASGIRLLDAATTQFTSDLSGRPLWRELPSPFTCGSDDGIPRWMDRLKSLGNAVVPQIPEIIGRAILACESACHERRAEVSIRHRYGIAA